MEHKGYFQYLQEHQKAVSDTWFTELRPRVCKWIDELTIKMVDDIIRKHDASKYNLDEFAANDNYYRSEDKDSLKSDLEIAKLHHQNANKHHWQYWVYISDDGLFKPVDIPLEYLCEMACGWQSFTRIDPEKTAANYYNRYKDCMIMTPHTRSVLEGLIRCFDEDMEIDE